MKVNGRTTIPLPREKPAHISNQPGDEFGSILQSGSLVQNTTDGVLMLDFNWRFIYLNNRARDLISSARELLGSNVWDEFPAAKTLKYWHNYHRSMNERVATIFVDYYRAPLDAWFILRQARQQQPSAGPCSSRVTPSAYAPSPRESNMQNRPRCCDAAPVVSCRVIFAKPIPAKEAARFIEGEPAGRTSESWVGSQLERAG